MNPYRPLIRPQPQNPPHCGDDRCLCPGCGHHMTGFHHTKWDLFTANCNRWAEGCGLSIYFAAPRRDDNSGFTPHPGRFVDAYLQAGVRFAVGRPVDIGKQFL